MWNSLEAAKLGASLLSPVVTVVGFLFVWLQIKNAAAQIGIARESLDASNTQNIKNQDWKRAEFVASQTREFYENETVFKVLQMLDYEARRYPIGLIDGAGQPVLTKVVHTEYSWSRQPGSKESCVSLASALKVHDDTTNFTPEEAIIRDFFDVFLYGIERFERFLTAGLFSEEELVPYLQYYIRLLRGELHVGKEVLDVVKRYMISYRYDQAYNLIYRRFAHLNLGKISELPNRVLHASTP